VYILRDEYKMTKNQLLKYIKGEATKEEELKIVEWANESPDNKEYLKSLNNLWLSQNIPSTQASEREMDMVRKITEEKKVVYWKSVLSGKTIRYAAAILVFLLVGSNLFLLNRLNLSSNEDERVLLSQIPQESVITVYTNKGVKSSVILPDSSQVWMNSDSKISYPAKFTGSTREIMVSGEVYFEVQKDNSRPMIVSTNKNFQIEVLGTKFNLKAYDDEKDAVATLYTGEIRIRTDISGSTESKEVLMKPMETVRIENNNIINLVKPRDTSTNIAWKDGILVFDNTPIYEVIKKIERWHGSMFIVRDSSVLNYRITATFNSESAIQIMEMIRYTSPVDYSIQDNTIIISKR